MLEAYGRKISGLERGESASRTGRDHIPLRVFKKMTRLTKQREKLEGLLEGMDPFNAKGRAIEIGENWEKCKKGLTFESVSDNISELSLMQWH